MKLQIILCFTFLALVAYCSAVPTETESDECEAGTDFKIGCNTCKCADSGKKSESACTLMACPEDSVAEDDDKCIPDTQVTIPGQCGPCTCGPDGKKSTAACNAAAC